MQAQGQDLQHTRLDPLAFAIACGGAGLLVGLLGALSTGMLAHWQPTMMSGPGGSPTIAWNALTGMTLGIAAWIAVWGGLAGAVVAWLYNAILARIRR
jgi:hypothetical protein